MRFLLLPLILLLSIGCAGNTYSPEQCARGVALLDELADEIAGLVATSEDLEKVDYDRYSDLAEVLATMGCSLVPEDTP